MKTKLMVSLAMMVLLGMNVTSLAQVIGNFETGLDGWKSWEDNPVPYVLETSTQAQGVALGRQCLRVTGDVQDYWGMYINAPNDINMPTSLAGVELEFDVTMIQSEWTGNQWTKVANAVALSSDGPDGWKEFAPTKVVDRVTGETTTDSSWGAWSPDSYKTIIVDISDYNVADANWLDIVISIQQNGNTGAGYFYIDNIRMVSGGGGVNSEDLPTADDPVIASFEQDMDGWEIDTSTNVEVTYNDQNGLIDEGLCDPNVDDPNYCDQNGVTEGNYCLDVYFPTNDWYQFMTLDVMDSNDKDVILQNQKIAMDITRMAGDYPDYPTDVNLWPWNNFLLVVEVYDANGNGTWTLLNDQANWTPRDGDPNAPYKPMTLKAVWDYGKVLDANIPNRNDITTFNLILVSNTNSEDYHGSVWFYLDNVQVFGGGKATAPDPGNYGIKVPVDATLSWRPGGFASFHHLYFGTDAAAVRDANLASDPNVTYRALDGTSVDLTPLNLAFGTTYYWRVDEVNQANPKSPWKGDVWNFTTANYIVIDNFEDYNDYAPDRVFDTWVDGYGVDDNGSQMGYTYSPFAEETIVHGGAQSSPLFYDNTALASESKVTRTWDTPQDFTINGFDTLKLYLYGKSGNIPGQLSVTLTDSNQIAATMVSPDTDFFALEQWTELSFPLQDFVDQGVDVSSIQSITISIANMAGQTAAQGDLLIDDIIVGH